MSTFIASNVVALQGIVASPGDVAILGGYDSAADGRGGTLTYETAPSSARISGAVFTTVTIRRVSGFPIVMVTTSVAHDYVSGQFVVVTGVTGMTGTINATWRVDVASSTTFILVGCTATGSFSGAASSTVATLTTSAAHGLKTGRRVMIGGVQGLSGANGTWPSIAVTSATTFTIGASGSGTYTAGTGVVGDGGLTFPSTGATPGRWKRDRKWSARVATTTCARGATRPRASTSRRPARPGRGAARPRP